MKFSVPLLASCISLAAAGALADNQNLLQVNDPSGTTQANIVQSGDDNLVKGIINGSGGIVGVSQSGNGNFHLISSSNTANAIHVDSSMAGDGNSSTIGFTPHFLNVPGSNTVTENIQGSSNYTETRVKGGGNNITTTIDGSSNRVRNTTPDHGNKLASSVNGDHNSLELFASLIGSVSATVTGDNNFVKATAGSRALTDIEQVGDGNFIAAYTRGHYVQHGNDNVIVSSPLGATQVDIVQTGAGNRSEFKTSNRSTLVNATDAHTVNITGHGNTTSTTYTTMQGAPGTGVSQENSDTTVISGDNNRVQVSMLGGFRNQLSHHIEGSGNVVLQQFALPASRVSSDIRVEGNGNTLINNHGGSQALNLTQAVAGNGNRAAITAKTSMNQAGSSVNVGMEGDNNILNLISGGRANMVSELSLTGNMNNVTMEQNKSAMTSFSDNSMTVQLSGDNNFLHLSQQGNMNVMQATVSGAGNVMGLAQTGNGNFTQATQAGMNNSMVGQLNGDNNSLSMSQQGRGNQMKVVFNGSDNTGSFTQIGDGLRLNIVHNGSGLGAGAGGYSVVQRR